MSHVFKLAALFEPKAPLHKRIAEGLKKAGLTVSGAQTVSELGKEQVVVLGPSVPKAAKLAGEVREALPKAFVVAAQAKGFSARFADAVLPLPVSPNDLKVRLAEWAKAVGEGAGEPTLRPGEGIFDPFTNFYTFKHFKEVLFIEVKRARRYGFPLALALIGFDPLPGPGTGPLHEQLMGGLALAIRRSLRDTDFPVQQAADRVLLLMPHTDLAGALIVARRVCERVSKATLHHGDQVLSPTISVGVAAGEPRREYGFSDLVRQAQDGLQLAIDKGGNRVEFYDSALAMADAPTRPSLAPPLP